jgi:hypothetical protein
MLRRAPVSGCRREHFLRKSLPERGWADPCQVHQLVVGSFRPSQWRRGLARSHGRERVRPRRYASCGQMMAGSTSRPARLSQYRFRPAGRAVGRDTRKSTSGPSFRPRVYPATRLLLPGQVRGVAGLGLSGVAASVRGVLGQLAAGGRSRATECCGPARGRRPLHLRFTGVTPRWASESVCLYRKPLADSSSWMHGLTCRSAPLGALWAAIPKGASPWAIARASGGCRLPG